MPKTANDHRRALDFDQRQRLLKSLLVDIVIRDGVIESAKPKADWLPHLEAAFTACPAWGLVGRQHNSGWHRLLGSRRPPIGELRGRRELRCPDRRR